MSDENEIPYLSLAERERLALLAEECGELVQAIGKVLRHGYNSVNPLVPLKDPARRNNRGRLEKEMGDVRAAMAMLCAAGDTDKAAVHSLADRKLREVLEWMHHQ